MPQNRRKTQAKLLNHLLAVPIDPRFLHVAIRNQHVRHAGNLYVALGWREAVELPVVCPRYRPFPHDAVLADDHLVDREVKVGKPRPKLTEVRFERLAPMYLAFRNAGSIDIDRLRNRLKLREIPVPRGHVVARELFDVWYGFCHESSPVDGRSFRESLASHSILQGVHPKLR